MGQPLGGQIDARSREAARRDHPRPDAYHGRDRRGLIVEDRAPGVAFHLATVGLLVMVVVAANLPRLAGPELDRTALAGQLDAVAFASAVLLCTLCLLRWRLVGDVAVLYLGVAAGVYGVATLGVGGLVAETTDLGGTSWAWLPPAGRAVGAALVVAALLSPEVDARRSLPRIAAIAVLALTALIGLFHLSPGIGHLFVSQGDRAPAGLEVVASWGLITTVAWGVLGVVAVVLGFRRRRHVFAWFGLGLLALAFAEGVAASVAPMAGVPRVGPPTLVAIGVFLALGGTVRELARAYRQQGGRLLASVTAEATTEAKLHADHAFQAERAHEARNVLAAIEAATKTLQHHHDRLDAASRVALSEGISAQVRQMQSLVAPKPGSGEPGRFRPSEAIASLVTFARSQGAEVEVDVPDHLVAVGRPAETTQVLQNLFQNAQRYGRGRIEVRAERDGDHVVLRLSDNGPGVHRSERERVFARGVRGRAAKGTPGEGLGLFVSQRLMRDQGGELRLEDATSGGGACFAVVLPGFSELPEQTLDELHERVQPDHAGQLLVLPSTRQPSDRPVAVDDDGGRRSDLAR
jgi:signal transduction histidine kinase